MLNGITTGWDQVRVGSGEPSRGQFCFQLLRTHMGVSLKTVSDGKILQVEWKSNGSQVEEGGSG